MALDNSICERISVQHVVILCLTELATAGIHQHLLGKDGRIAIERMKYRLKKELCYHVVVK